MLRQKAGIVERAYDATSAWLSSVFQSSEPKVEAIKPVDDQVVKAKESTEAELDYMIEFYAAMRKNDLHQIEKLKLQKHNLSLKIKNINDKATLLLDDKSEKELKQRFSELLESYPDDPVDVEDLTKLEEHHASVCEHFSAIIKLINVEDKIHEKATTELLDGSSKKGMIHA